MGDLFLASAEYLGFPGCFKSSFFSSFPVLPHFHCLLEKLIYQKGLFFYNIIMKNPCIVVREFIQAGILLRGQRIVDMHSAIKLFFCKCV